MCGRSAVRYARPVVAHGQRAAAQRHLDRAARRRELRRVVEQVVDRPPEPLRHAVDGDGLEVGAERDPGRVAARALERLADERVQPHVLQLLLGLVAARELDQVRHQRGELLGLLDHVVEHSGVVARRILAQQLRVRAQRRDRRAQLVRRVRDERPLRRLRRLDPLEQRGEAVRDPRTEHRRQRDGDEAEEQQHEPQAGERVVDAGQRARRASPRPRRAAAAR